MKTTFKKISSILLTVVMLFSVFAVVSASAAETSDAVGASNLTVTGSSNYCTVSEPVTVQTDQTVTVTFKNPAQLNLVSIQWGMNYDSTKLQYQGVTAFTDDMLVNPNATGYNVMGSISNNGAPFTLAQGATVLTFTFKAIGTGDASVFLKVEDLMNRTATGDEILVNNGVVQQEVPFKVNAASNFFAAGSKSVNNVNLYKAADGNVYVTVEYKLQANNMYLINIDIDELTYDPAVLEWQESYNMYGNVVDLFPFAAEYNFGPGTYQLTAPGRLVGNFTSVKPAAWAYGEHNDPITAVKAVFKVKDLSAGETTVTCNIDTLTYCSESVSQPYMQYIAIDKKVVNATNKAKGTYSTDVDFGAAAEGLLGDVNNDGVVNIQDATTLQRYFAEYTNIGAVNLAVADVNRDGKINIRDVTQLQRFVAGFITAF